MQSEITVKLITSFFTLVINENRKIKIFILTRIIEFDFVLFGLVPILLTQYNDNWEVELRKST